MRPLLRMGIEEGKVGPGSGNARAVRSRAASPAHERSLTGNNRALARFIQTAMHARSRHGPGDTAANAVAAKQFGFVSREQARLCGLTRKAIHGRRAHGLWRRWHPGVWLIGPGEPDLRGEILAAILSVPGGAAASGATVSWLRGLTRREPNPIEIVSLGGRPSRRKGICVREYALAGDDLHWIGPIPVTSTPVTLIQRAGQATFDHLEAEVALALRNHLTSMTKLREAVVQAGGAPGIANLRAIAAQDRVQVTRSENERILRRLIKAADLGPAEFNVDLGRHELDVYWPELRLGIEVDDFATHGDADAFERDRWRDGGLAVEEIEIRRVTRAQLRTRELAVVARIGAFKALRARTLNVQGWI